MFNDKICDGIVDCLDASDEFLCDYYTEELNEKNSICHIFQLQKMICIFKSLRENGKTFFYGNISRNVKNLKIEGNIEFLNNSNFFYLSVLVINNNNVLINRTNVLITPNLFSLSINNFKKLENFNFFAKQEMAVLQYLNISFNNFIHMNIFSRIKISNLLEIDFSYSSLNHLKKLWFLNLTNLEIIHFVHVKFHFIDNFFFQFAENLKIIHLQKTFLPFEKIPELFLNLKKIKKVYSSQFQICCLFKNAFMNNVKCIPNISKLISCDKIIASQFVKILLWLYSIFGIFGNFITIIIILKKKNKTSLKSFRLCLSFSDLISNFYIISICIIDYILYGNEYLKREKRLREGITCNILGMSISFSLIFSMFIINGISIEKFYAIVLPLRINLMKKYTNFFLMFFVFVSIFIATFPIFFLPVN